MVRARDGSLLTVEEGKGNIAFVSFPNGSIIPDYRGRDYRGQNYDWFAGGFNEYFIFDSYRGLSLTSYIDINTGKVISTWTTRVVTDIPMSYQANSSVENWTGMVLGASN